MDNSTVYAYREYFTFLRNLGISPYKLNYANSQLIFSHNIINNSKDFENSISYSSYSSSGNKNRLSSITFHNGGIHYFKHLLLFGFFYIYGIFQLVQFVIRCKSGAGAIELFGMTCWMWKPIFVASFIIHFHLKVNSVSIFHTNWHLVESSIYDSWKFILPVKVSKFSKKIIRHKRFAMMYIPLWTICIIIWMALNQINSPEFPSYISSYINNPLDPNQYYWLFYVSLTVQIVALVIILLTFDHFYVLCLTFSNAVSQALILIAYPFELEDKSEIMTITSNHIFEIPVEDSTNTNNQQYVDIKNIFGESNYRKVGGGGSSSLTNFMSLTDKMKLAMQHFGMLERLTDEFNLVYRWMFFLYKGVILINFCILIFVPLRFSRIFPWTSLIVFFISAAFFSFHLVTVLPAMGKVFAKSTQFQAAWMKRLPELCNSVGEIIKTSEYLKLKGQLDSCLPFGFQSGTFYTVMPESMLVFFSIATSYLIVLLQLDIN